METKVFVLLAVCACECVCMCVYALDVGCDCHYGSTLCAYDAIERHIYMQCDSKMLSVFQLM